MKGANRTYLDVPEERLIFSAEHPLIYFSFHSVLLDDFFGARNKARSGPIGWGDSGGALRKPPSGERNILMYMVSPVVDKRMAAVPLYGVDSQGDRR